MGDIISLDAGVLRFISQDFDGIILEEFHKDDEEIARLLQFLAVARTPVWTGAAQESIKYEVDPNPQSETLVVLYTEDAPQIEAWGRVYFPYIEGGKYGLPTWTNPPREVFAKSETEDLPLIEAWGEATLTIALEKLTNIGSI